MYLFIGDVAHEHDAIATIFQIPPHDIERDFGARMTDVAEVINGIAANIHAYDAGFVSA